MTVLSRFRGDWIQVDMSTLTCYVTGNISAFIISKQHPTQKNMDSCFWSDKEASFSKERKDDKPPLERALEFSKQNGNLPVWGKQIGTKNWQFLSMSVMKLWQRLAASYTSQRTFYEVIQGKLFFKTTKLILTFRRTNEVLCRL